MNKIEERAGNFADNFTAYDSPVLANLLHYVVKDGYVKGATEQNEIIRDRLMAMQGEYITLELINELVKEIKGQ